MKAIHFIFKYIENYVKKYTYNFRKFFITYSLQIEMYLI